MSSSFAAGIPAWAQCSMLLLNPNVFPLLQEFQHGLLAFPQPLCLPFAAGIPAWAPCFCSTLMSFLCCRNSSMGSLPLLNPYVFPLLQEFQHELLVCSTLMSFLCCRNSSMGSMLLLNPYVFPLLQEFQHEPLVFAQP
jgi:TRAP-type C4-dicarboxylate transport system permease large subunit